MPLWVTTTFFCMAALAGQQWARPVRRDGCASQCGGDCHVTASAAANGAAQDQPAAAQHLARILPLPIFFFFFFFFQSS